MNASAFGIVVAAILTNNILLSNYLGVCPFLAGSRRISTAWALGLAVMVVTTCAVAINHAVYHVLLGPDLEYLHLMAFVVVIAGFVQAGGAILGRRWPIVRALAPMATVNCAVLGVSLLAVIHQYDFARAVAFGFGAGAGWAMAILLMAALQRKMDYSDVPRPFRGLAIALIVTGLMAMAMAGFVGLASVE